MLNEQVEHSIEGLNLDDLAAWTVAEAMRIQQIAAPTFAERPRAEYVAQRFRALGLDRVEIDDVDNVYGRLPGADANAPGLMISAHTDTVFPADTDLRLDDQSKPGWIYGVGLGDNSMGVAGMLALVEGMQRVGIKPARDLWCVATSREEGLGDLGGMRAAYARLRERIDAVINIEGLAFGHLYNAGIAVRRWKIKVNTPGGHSWLHFGKPSAIHILMMLGAQITALHPPTHPRTTYNIGLVEGGQSVNSIASEASLWLDLRSEDSATLTTFQQQIMNCIEALRQPEVVIDCELVGDRPAGRIAVDHPLIWLAVDALKRVGGDATLETGSTDGNIPLADGCPTVTIGITRGGSAHTRDEYIEVEPVAVGVRQLLLLVLSAAQTRFST